MVRKLEKIFISCYEHFLSHITLFWTIGLMLLAVWTIWNFGFKSVDEVTARLSKSESHIDTRNRLLSPRPYPARQVKSLTQFRFKKDS
jgi:hypothetical protein